MNIAAMNKRLANLNVDVRTQILQVIESQRNMRFSMDLDDSDMLLL